MPLRPHPSSAPRHSIPGDTTADISVPASGTTPVGALLLDAPPPSFEQLYDEQYAFVSRTVRRLGVPEEAVEDVCQEVFVVVHRRLSEFEGRSKLRTWIYRIVANSVRNQQRTQRRKAPHTTMAEPIDPEQLATNHLGPEARVGRGQAAELARAILMTMSEERRMAFVLVELEDMSYAEAAASLDTTFDTVRARVRAARAEFSRHVRRLQAFPGSGASHA